MIFHKVSPPVIHTELFVAFTAFVVKTSLFIKIQNSWRIFATKVPRVVMARLIFCCGGGFIVEVGLDFGATSLHPVVGEGDK
jgi:hypothetical protein